MRKIKYKNIKNKRGITSVFVVVGVILVISVWWMVYGGGIRSSRQTKTENNIASTQETPSPTPYPIDAVNDGVYTNYEYGFRFEYPEEIFTKQYPYSTSNNSVWTKQEWFDGGGTDNLYMSVTTRNKNQSTTMFKYVVGLNINEEIGEHRINYAYKIQNLGFEFTDGVIYYTEEDHTTTYRKTSYLYVVEWTENDILITIKMGSNNKDTFENHVDVLSSIISTLEKIDEK